MADRSGSNIAFLDKSFSKEKCRSCMLAFHINHAHLTCVVFSPEQNRYLALISSGDLYPDSEHPIASQFENMVKEHDWLDQAFEKVNVIIGNHLNTLIPAIIFDEDATNTYLEFNHEPGEGFTTYYDRLKNTGAVNVYAIEDGIIEKVNRYYPGAEFWHFASIFIESNAISHKNLMDNKLVFMNVRNDSFDLLHFKDGKLNFYNLFSYKTKEDFTYFLLAAFEQLELNPEEVKLQIAGGMDEGDRLHDMIYRYVRHSAFIQKNETYGYSSALEKVKHHHHHVLFNLPQCVS
jgi:hypothetical protein